MIKIYGSSDDLIEIEGDIREESNWFADEDRSWIALSDGTLLQVEYSSLGIWRFEIVELCHAIVTTDRNPETDDERYSDVVSIAGDIKWILHGESLARVEK